MSAGHGPAVPEAQWVERALQRHRATDPLKTIRFSCQTCSQYHEPYMVHDELWLSVYETKHCVHCWRCLESKLGRALTITDLTHALVNEPYFIGYALATRMRV